MIIVLSGYVNMFLFQDANGSMGLTSGGIRKDPLEMCPGETVVKIVSGGDHLVCLTNKGEIFTGGLYSQNNVWS